MAIALSGDHWGITVAERNDGRNVGLPCQPLRQDSLQLAGSDFLSADVAGESHNPDAVPRGLLQHHDVISGQPWLDRHDYLAACRVLEFPSRGMPRPRHKQRLVSRKILWRERQAATIEIVGRGEEEPGSWRECSLYQRGVRERSGMGSDRKVIAAANDIDRFRRSYAGSR
jgi:hypothetical protein